MQVAEALLYALSIVVPLVSSSILSSLFYARGDADDSITNALFLRRGKTEAAGQMQLTGSSTMLQFATAYDRFTEPAKTRCQNSRRLVRNLGSERMRRPEP